MKSFVLVLAALWGCVGLAYAEEPVLPCVLVGAAFEPEVEAVATALAVTPGQAELAVVNGVGFRTVTLAGRRFVFFATGPGPVNAAMNLQLAADRFHPTAVFFVGMAGGVDPDLVPGDVVVPVHWHDHTAALYLNETAPGQYALPGIFKQKYLNFGMIFPEDAMVRREGMSKAEQAADFRADDKLLAAAQSATAGFEGRRAGDRAGRIVYGGDGVSGGAICDNAEYRRWLFRVWKAQCVDTESAAVAQTCWQNKLPCLIVRGLGELAGNGANAGAQERSRQLASDNAARVLARILQSIDLTGPVH